ncbi:hypothetical protein DM02DRAFT_383975 [Periconia macrospinosa]|uniref:Uncharacterized protein n=1 Tax=Periconia macrospinosa TaxID=97972 RepID=A0A2V1EAI8_9PLEO|nr:hypothetical protein DM02DRAFT_383975 [Periconia macrospinosa]
MFSAPLIHIRTQPGSETDTSAITQNLLPLLHSSSSFEPVLLKTTTPNGSDTTQDIQPTTEDGPINNRRIMLFTDPTNTHQTLTTCQQVARSTARTFIPVTLLSKTPATSGRTTPNSMSDSSIVNEEEVGDENCVGVVSGGSGSERELVLDVTSLAPEEVAGKIARWVWWVGEFMSWDDE